MKVVVTGSSGFVGSALIAALVDRGHEVVALDRRRKTQLDNASHYYIDLVRGKINPDWFKGADVVVHLAGASIFSRWTRNYKERLHSSRVTSAHNIIDALLQLPKSQRPHVVITASAVGYYGNTREMIATEDSSQGTGMLADLCHEWEAAWQSYVDESVRFVAIRSGLVIDEHGGLLGVVRPLIRRGMASVFGSGRQWVSWISLRDLLAVYLMSVESVDIEGPVNAVAPRPMRHRDFVRRLAALYGQRVRFYIPGWMARLLLGEAAELLLSSHRIKPSKLIKRNFKYRDPSLKYLRG